MVETKDIIVGIVGIIGVIIGIATLFFSNDLRTALVAIITISTLVIIIYTKWEDFKSYPNYIPVILFGIASVFLIYASIHVGGLENNITEMNKNIINLKEENKLLEEKIVNLTKNEPYILDISYDGTFDAGFDSNKLSKPELSSYNHVAFDLGNPDGFFVNAGAKKTDGGSGILTLKVMKGDKIIEEKSTSEPYGEVKIHI